MNIKRCIRKFLLAAVLIPAFAFGVGRTAYGAVVYYEKTGFTQLSRDTYYKSFQQVTDEGLRDIYVLSVPLNDPYIVINPVESANEYGKKETTYQLISEAGAIAGVNGDFFGMNGSYSASFGPVVEDGQLVSLSQGVNAEENNYASFCIGKDGNPFILYLRTEINFYNNGNINLDVVSINKINDMLYPTYVDRSAYESTATLDARFEGLVKLVIEDGKITYISKAGETVNIPELNKGFVITMTSHTWSYNDDKFAVGQDARIEIKAGVDFNTIQTAIGGGGRLLLEGQPVTDTGVTPTGRQPRTALGISQDKSKLILMVVDGRTHSIGATVSELADLMLAHGAYSAMLLDGGGSTTMAIRDSETAKTEVINTVSDGSQRKVMNALGVFNESQQGAVASIAVYTERTYTFDRNPLEVKVYGYDEYMNRIELPEGSYSIVASDLEGQWSGSLFYPSQTGRITFVAAYGALTAQEDISVYNLSALTVSPSKVTVGVGGSAALTVSGKSPDGYTGYLNHGGLNFEVYPAELGYIEDGKFVGTSMGAGYIKCSVGDIVTYIDVKVAYTSQQITSFENDRTVYYKSYPDGITGSAGITQAAASDGGFGAFIQYAFEQKPENQAAYAVMEPVVAIPGGTVSLKLSVYGDNSGKWLRGRLLDANGNESIVTLASSIDWDGWKEIEVALPDGLAAPVTLERIYVASAADEAAATGAIYFDNLRAVVKLSYPSVEIPASTVYSDYMEASLTEAPADGSFDVAVLPATTVPAAKDAEPVVPDNYGSVTGQALEKFKVNTSLGIYAGNTDLATDLGFTVHKREGYTAYDYQSVGVFHMTASEGGFFSTDVDQWRRFTADVLAIGQQNLIIVLDKNPLDFAQPKEAELFHEILKELRQTGRNIIVVSAEGSSSWATAKDGVRYINLGSLFKEDGSVNENFGMLRVRVTGSGMVYDLQN